MSSITIPHNQNNIYHQKQLQTYTVDPHKLNILKPISNEVLSHWHPHPLKPVTHVNAWKCSGRLLPGGCYRGSYCVIIKSSMIPCVGCEICGFYLCDLCAMFPERTVDGPRTTAYFPDEHEHELRYTEGVRRCDVCRKDPVYSTYQCKECSWDMCISCFMEFKYEEDESKTYDNKWHEHSLIRLSERSVWRCSGVNLPGGCPCGEKPFSGVKYEEFDSTPHYACKKCDFHLCQFCLNLDRYPSSPGEQVNIKSHIHPFNFSYSSGRCDSCNEHSTNLFSCSTCSYKLCMFCFADKLKQSEGDVLLENMIKTYELSQIQLAQLKQLFSVYDIDRDGVISKSEAISSGKLLSGLGLELMESIFDEIKDNNNHNNNNNGLNFAQFVQWLLKCSDFKN
eukprot:TRINITY_DN867_c0_g1_i2.p1 TRINITY_DN867_c0_g1~~TRINITY_DN867_c0_g1_i2.p1  ORF type:complete len:394 (+),score=26.18 TRINITY_DN867_c0_g1_i2:111-1292(+)